MTVLDTAPAQPTIETDPRDPRVRLESLFDEGTFRPLAGGDRSGKLAGRGRIEGLPVVAFASDPRVMGGAMGTEGCAAVVAAYDLALRERLPIIGLWHSGGARLAEGVESLHAVGLVFAQQTRASGVVPQISVVLGPAAGGAAYGPALTDIVVLSENGKIFVTGPDVVKSVTGEEIDMAGLGGADAHGTKSGVAHITTSGDAEAVTTARKLAVLLGHQGRIRQDEVEERDFSDFLPESVRRAYSVLPLVKGVVDGEVIELQAKWAPNIVTAFGRLGGRTVGVIANNPLRKGGCLDSISAEKCARFVRLCDAFGVPLVVLVDVPGYLPGVGQEHGGVVRRGAKLLHAFAEATVPRVTLVTRKAYGGAYIAMNSRSLGATKVFAWPTAEVAVMGALAAVRVLHRKKIAAVPEEERPAFEERLAVEHAEIAGGLQRAMDLGVVDEVVSPAATRAALARAIAEATPARGLHNNIPL
ncbi:acetyl-CoA/propionyl-CoA carboxylase carboxyl transferase subunit [Actinocorallia herbida]|uniref:Acetyl-CoA/propionyl-CoA carboxylase carboxyl transferase subunit n=1 Tax=Actinocorallia herbida TaxID=58109 RepID=A0A3N1D739_9ACTN|nr:carboxyl transferase domain-containing protein [Actinocorallia herbida]ROO89345.1 acetyl-CoA/propionyl-CoA carboxylase carboxyl transferase subunit [Actinocorallia herbida]